MKTVLEILKGVRSDIDFENETALIDDGILDSFDTVEIVTRLEDEFGIEVPPAKLTPENFNSLSGIEKLVEDLKK